MNGMSRTRYSVRSLLKSVSISSSRCIGVKQRNKSEVKIKKHLYICYKFVHTYFFTFLIFVPRGIEQWCSSCSPQLISTPGSEILADSYTHLSQIKSGRWYVSLCTWDIYKLILEDTERHECLWTTLKPSICSPNLFVLNEGSCH